MQFVQVRPLALVALVAVAALPVMLIPAVPELRLEGFRFVMAEPSPKSEGKVGVKASTVPKKLPLFPPTA